MKQENKELLFKDICARLPYNVIVHIHDHNTIDYDNYLYVETLAKFESNDITLKPYLKPMSNMTDEEKIQLSQYACIGEDLNGEFIDEVQRKDCAAYIDWLNKKMFDSTDWLNKNHFDYRGLILKGLALEAPEGMYNIKEKITIATITIDI